MADASKVQRVLGVVAPIAAGVGLGLAGAIALAGTSFGALTLPGWGTILAAGAGLGAGLLALRSGLALRLLAFAALLGVAGASLTRFGPGVALAFAAGPLWLWTGRTLRGFRGDGGFSLLLLAAIATIFALPRSGGRFPTNGSSAAFVAGALVLAGVLAVAVTPRERSGTVVRFDLRAALAVATLVLVGFALAFFAGQGSALLATPREYGGLETGRVAWNLWMTVGAMFGWSVVAGCEAPTRLLLGLGGLTTGFLLLTLGPVAATFAGLFLLLFATRAVDASLNRLFRVREGVGPAALGLATFLGMPLAGGLAGAFSKPLPGLLAVGGVEVARRTDWTPVLLFYAALGLVVLLAHLAHVYEFGVAALSPEDGRDPLPILRKGFSRGARKG